MKSIAVIGEMALQRLFLTQVKNGRDPNNRKVEVIVNKGPYDLSSEAKYRGSGEWPAIEAATKLQFLAWGTELGIKHLAVSDASVEEVLLDCIGANGWVYPTHIIHVLSYCPEELDRCHTIYQIFRISQEQLRELKAKRPRTSVAFG